MPYEKIFTPGSLTLLLTCSAFATEADGQPFFLHSMPNSALAVENRKVDENVWLQLEASCENLRFPRFQSELNEFKKFVGAGKIWQNSVKLEKIQIDQVTLETCKKWAENPNGESALREFIEKFSNVSSSAISIKKNFVEYLNPNIQRWQKNEAQELIPYGLHFKDFFCGKAFTNTQQHIARELVAIEGKFALLREKCPKAAEQVISEGKRSNSSKPKITFGNGGVIQPEGLNRRPANYPVSDISGTAMAIENEVKNKKIIKQKK